MVCLAYLEVAGDHSTPFLKHLEDFFLLKTNFLLEKCIFQIFHDFCVFLKSFFSLRPQGVQKIFQINIQSVGNVLCTYERTFLFAV